MKTKGIITASAILLVVGAAAVYLLLNQDSPSTRTQSETSARVSMHEDYSEVPEDNRFVIESDEQTIDRFKNGTGIILLGFKECPWCQKIAPLLNQAAEEGDVPVYYLDIRKLRSDNTASYQSLVTILEPYLQKDENGQPRISVPDVSFVKDGKIVWRHEMEQADETERTPDTYWTEARKKQAVADFLKHIEDVKKGDTYEGI